MGKPALHKEHVGRERVEVRVEVEVLTESVDCKPCATQTAFETEWSGIRQTSQSNLAASWR